MHYFLKVLAIVLVSIQPIQNQLSKTISPLNLLLPVSSETKVEFLVQAYNGCYKFTSSEPSVISITPIYAPNESSECTTKAIARVEVHTAVRSIVWLIAEEESTGLVLRCESRVAELDKIEIMTRLRSLDVGVYETIELTGYDAYGNAFNTLEGLKFNWNINQIGPFAELSTFKESSLEVSRIRQKIENNSEFADQLVLKTKKIGKVTVDAQLKDSRMKKVKTSVQLYISEHIIFKPDNEIWLSRCSSIKINAYLLKGDKNNRRVEKIEDMSRFKIKVLDHTIGDVDMNGLVKSKEAVGQTIIEITDTQNVENVYQIRLNVAEIDRLQANMYIVGSDWSDYTPSQDEINLGPKKRLGDLEPIDNFTAIVNNIVLIKLSARGRSFNELALDNEKIEWTGLTDKFQLLFKDNSMVIIKPKSLGSFDLGVHLIKDKCHQESIKMFKKLYVQSQLLVLLPRNTKNEIYMPSLQQTVTPQTLQLSIIGGSDQYLCISSNPSCIRVNKDNSLAVESDGSAKVRCQDKDNSRNFDEFTVIVESLGRLIPHSRSESLIDVSVLIPWRVLGTLNQFYANCSLINPSINPRFFKNETNPTQLKIEKISPVYSRFAKTLWTYIGQVLTPYHVSVDHSWKSKEKYTQYLGVEKDYEERINKFIESLKGLGICGFVDFQAARSELYKLDFFGLSLKPEGCQVKVHNPLLITIIQNYDADIFQQVPLISWDTSVNLQLSGGPEGWNEIARPLLSVQASDNGKYVQVNSKTSGNEFIVEVHCRSLTELEKDSTFVNDKPKEITVSFRISNLPDDTLENPAEVTGQFKVQCGSIQNIRHFAISELDLKDYKFIGKIKNYLNLRNNKSHNLAFWAFDESNKPFWNFTFANVRSVLKDPTFLNGRFRSDPWSNSNIPFHLLRKHGSSLFILDLPKETGQASSIVTADSSSRNEKPVNSELTIRVTEELELDPSRCEIFLHPTNRVPLNILNGSGHFKVSIDDNIIASITHTPDSRKITVLPNKKGKTTVKVQDVGMESGAEATTEVIVIDISDLAFELKDKLIENQKETELTFKGSTFLKEQLDKLPIRLYTNPARGIEFTKVAPGLYKVKGLENGQFSVQADIEDKTIPMNAMLRVYPKIEFFPDKLVMMPNCLSYFSLVGGPKELLSGEYTLNIKKKDGLGIYSEVKPGFYKFESKKGTGKTEIEMEVEHNGKILTQLLLPVIIANPTDIFINGPDNLLEGASAVITGFPRYEYDEFSPGFCEFEFHYKVISDNGVLSTIPLSYSQSPNPSFVSLMVKAEKLGNEQIRFELHNDNSRTNSLISKVFSIQVIKNHDLSTTMLLGKTCNCSTFGDGSYLIPPNSTFTIPQNLFVKITPIDSVVVLDGLNNIVSLDKIGYDSLTFSDNKNYVKAFKHVQVSVPQFLVVENMHKITYLQGKSTTILKVYYMNAIGRLFTPTSSPMELEIMNADPNIADVFYDPAEGELTIQSKKDGKTMISIKSVEFPKLVCPLMILIGTVISPQGPLFLHVGSRVAFESGFDKMMPLSPNSEVASHDKWQSNDPSVIMIKDKNGKASAIKIGNAKVGWKSEMSPEVDVFVTEIEAIRLRNGNITFTNIKNNEHYQKYYELEYEFRLKGTNKELTLHESIDHHLNFRCDSNNKNVEAKPKYPRMNYFPRGENSQDSHAPLPMRGICIVKFAEFGEPISDLKITVEVGSNYNSFKIRSVDSLNVISGFSIHPDDRSIQLNKQEPSRIIEIRTPAKLTFFTSSNIKNWVKSTWNPAKNVHVFSVDFPNGFNEQLEGSIEFRSIETQQTETVNIVFDRTITIFSYFSIFDFSNSRFSFSDICMLIVCVFILTVIGLTFKRSKDDSIDASKFMQSHSRFSKSKFE